MKGRGFGRAVRPELKKGVFEMEAAHQAFWLRSWIAEEIGLAPHCFGQSITFKDFAGRISYGLSKSPKYLEFFSTFSPLGSEFCIKQITPDHMTRDVFSFFPKNFALFITNRRMFWESQSGIECVTLAEIAECEAIREGETTPGLKITKADREIETLRFRNKFLRKNDQLRFIETLTKNVLDRAQASKEKSDVLALNAAAREYVETQKLTQYRTPSSSGNILVGILGGLFFFFTSMQAHMGIGGSLIIGVGALMFGSFAAEIFAKGRGLTESQKKSAGLLAETQLNARDKDGRTPLHLAALDGGLDVAEVLLAHRVEVNAADNLGETPLHYAAFKGHIELVRLLLANRANVNVKDRDGETATHLADEEGHTKIADLLRSHGGQ